MATRKPNPQKSAASRSRNSGNGANGSAAKKVAAVKKAAEVAKPIQPAVDSRTHAGRPSLEPTVGTRQRSARLRLVHIDPWSVMRTTFLLSIVLGIATVVAVFMIWVILAGAGVWDSINHSVRDTVGSTTTTPFDITHYIGLGRVVGFTMLAAVIDAVLFTAVATLGAFLYNLSANLLGGIEATYAEER